MDQGRRRKDRLYRAWTILGKRLFRELNDRFRDELLNGEIFYSLKEGQIVIEQWRRHYNTNCTHSALGYQPPAPISIIPMEERPMMH